MIFKINLIWANLKVPQVQIPPKSEIIQKNCPRKNAQGNRRKNIHSLWDVYRL